MRFNRSLIRCRPFSLAVLLGGLFLSAPSLAAQSAQSEDPFRSMKARNIGPAGMSGRVADVAVDPSDKDRIFVGAATGGVWLSEDGGDTWEPVFDQEAVQGIGAISVSPANPDLIWVGTGEGNPRNTAGVGYGVYRSVDGGQTWARIGLEESERIHRIIPHPTKPDVAWVAAMGPAWSAGEVRGVYKTTDRGTSWEKVLSVGPCTGAADLVLDPRNPDKLFAVMWEYRRTPWSFQSGGPESGLYVTRDGGHNWKRVGREAGLPSRPLGRIGLAIADSDPDRVYALVEAKKDGLYRSEDGGRSWKLVNDAEDVHPRPLYYSDLRVHPDDPGRVYRLGGTTAISDDGGRNFSETLVPSRRLHGDVHDLWIDPDDPSRMIQASDGGVGISENGGDSWRFVENLPIGQFYHVSVDQDVPYNVYGGMQDNGSWYGPNTSWDARGIMNAHWRRVGCCDGFTTLVDFSNPRFVFNVWQNGTYTRYDKRTAERRHIRPIREGGERLRFNWDAPLTVDAHDSATIYAGSQHIHRSRDGGQSWETISPDLTKKDSAKQHPALNNDLSTEDPDYGTLIAIATSPVDSTVIWATTDDGNIQLSRDDGATWHNAAMALPTSAPDSAWTPSVEPSHHDASVAYAVIDHHRRGDWGTYVYRTEDYGQSWERLSTDSVFGYGRVIVEDPGHPDLLFLGTEFGLYVSTNRGQSWTKWSHELPAVQVRDLVVHPSTHDLVIGTHGRAIWILDDIRPLRKLAANPSLRERDLHLFPPPPARQYEVAFEGGLGVHVGYRTTGDAMFFGESQPYGAQLSYWISGESSPSDSVTAVVRSDDGSTVRRLRGPSSRGIGRVSWDLHYGEQWPNGQGCDAVSPPEVPPGRYRVITRGPQTADSAMLRVEGDPRVDLSASERRAKLDALIRVGGWLCTAERGRQRLRDVSESVDRVLADLDDSSALYEQGRSLRDSLKALQERLYPEFAFGRGDTPFGVVNQAYSALSSSPRSPSANDRALIDEAERNANHLFNAVDQIITGPVSEYRSALREEGYSPIPAFDLLSNSR